MPLGDWQFWVVTIIAFGALLVMIRVLMPARKPRSKKTQLTVRGERIEK